MHFAPRVFLSFILTLSLLVEPSLHFIHVCVGSCQISSSCPSDRDHSNCGSAENFSSDKECKICEMLATFTWAYSSIKYLYSYLELTDDLAVYKRTLGSSFVNLYSARAPPFL